MKVIINSKYQRISEFIYSIPSIFDGQGELIYNQRNIIKTFCYDGLDINVKSFKKPILINQFIYRYIRKSKAERSFYNAKYIQDRGIDTPEPIAYIEICKNGLLTESYYISVHERVIGTMKNIYKQSDEENRGLIQAFTLFTAELHKKDIFHKDYSPGNILYKEDNNGYKFYLIDLNRMRFKKVNMKDSCKSFEKLRANNNTLNLISEEYSKSCKYDEKICQELIHSYNRRFWERYLLRHPECEN